MPVCKIPASVAVLVDDLLSIARRAGSPNTGWAAMCQRAAPELGARIEPLRAVDLADDALDLRGILVELRRARRIPRGCDTLQFAIGKKLVVSGLRRGAPVWIPENGEVALEGLGAVQRAARSARAARAGWRALVLGATALVARFAAHGAKQGIAVAPEGGEPIQVSP
jgi:hypothetical protein